MAKSPNCKSTATEAVGELRTKYNLPPKVFVEKVQPMKCNACGHTWEMTVAPERWT